jgi:hypothetical protein
MRSLIDEAALLLIRYKMHEGFGGTRNRRNRTSQFVGKHGRELVFPAIRYEQSFLQAAQFGDVGTPRQGKPDRGFGRREVVAPAVASSKQKAAARRNVGKASTTRRESAR